MQECSIWTSNIGKWQKRVNTLRTFLIHTGFPKQAIWIFSWRIPFWDIIRLHRRHLLWRGMSENLKKWAASAGSEIAHHCCKSSSQVPQPILRQLENLTTRAPIGANKCAFMLSFHFFVSFCQREHWWQKCWWLGDCACKPADVQTRLPIASSASKKRRAGSLQNAEQCSLSKQWKCWSCSYCWSWLSTPLTVGRAAAAAAAGNSGWLPITTQHYIYCTPPLLWFLSSTAASWALLPSHQMYFLDAQVLLRCIFGRTTGLKISLGLHLCLGNDMQGPWDCITITHCTCREQPAILMKRLMLVKGSCDWIEIIEIYSQAQSALPCHWITDSPTDGGEV